MLTRIVTGTLAAVVALAAILWREPWGLLLLCVVIALVGVVELKKLTGEPTVAVLAPWAVGCILFGLACQLEVGVFLAILSALWLAGLVLLIVWRPYNLLQGFALSPWLFAGIGSAWWLYLQVVELGAGEFWASLLLLALVPLWVGDSLAYFVGKAIGKHKLAPSISPNKTWEGAVANLVGCLAAAYAIGLWLKVPLPASIAVGLTTGILGQVGDLLQSRLKRLAEVKDSGSILPGHGGVLDRLDSFLFSSYPSLLALYLLAPETFHVKQWPW